MFVTLDGSTITNQYLNTSHLLLTHAGAADSLLLAEFSGDKAYENYRVGQTRADGRSLLGSIRLKGDNWKKDQWECGFLANPAQVALFEQLLQLQQDTGSNVLLTDRWTYAPIIKNVWIDTDRQYLSTVAVGQWYRLQFQLLEV
jgi:hypothetical protein